MEMAFTLRWESYCSSGSCDSCDSFDSFYLHCARSLTAVVAIFCSDRQTNEQKRPFIIIDIIIYLGFIWLNTLKVNLFLYKADWVEVVDLFE